MHKKFIQYELWKDCNLNCQFCYNKLLVDNNNKIDVLNFVLNEINTLNFLQYQQIGFIGGQFFNGQLNNQQVKSKFYRIFQQLSKKNNIQKIYITAALKYNIQKYLISFLKFLKSLNLLNKILLCTSYDTKYRFHTINEELLWKKNMLQLKKVFPQIKLHTEIILTQHFINLVLNNKFNIKEFQKIYSTRIDYIQPIFNECINTKQNCMKLMPQFLPSKQSFLKFLYKTCIIQNIININDLLNSQLKSDTLLFFYNNKLKIMENRKIDYYSKNNKINDIFVNPGCSDSSETLKNLVIKFKKII